jgi:hypothetical protein
MIASLAIRCLANLANLTADATKKGARAHGQRPYVPRAQQAAGNGIF